MSPQFRLVLSFFDFGAVQEKVEVERPWRLLLCHSSTVNPEVRRQQLPEVPVDEIDGMKKK
jgi:hypothetical protein